MTDPLTIPINMKDSAIPLYWLVEESYGATICAAVGERNEHPGKPLVRLSPRGCSFVGHQLLRISDTQRNRDDGTGF